MSEICKNESMKLDELIAIQKEGKLKELLKEMNRMVGLEKFKSDIVKQIAFLLQGFEEDMTMHTVLMGDPGVGKTTVANLLAKIYAELGFLSEGKVIKAYREDFVGQYLGETAIKTKKLLNRSIGNVLLIDEAYSIGTKDNDMYAKECVNVINQFLSEHKGNFICIIAGYEKELETNFFALNLGLHRRFPWRYHLENYKAEELVKIFRKLLADKRWKYTGNMKSVLYFIRNNIESFKYNGGDIEKWIQFSMIEHSLRIFKTKKRSLKRKLNYDDLMEGFNK